MGLVAPPGSVGVPFCLFSLGVGPFLCLLLGLNTLSLVLLTGDFTGLSNFGRLSSCFGTVRVSSNHSPLILKLSKEGCLADGY